MDVTTWDTVFIRAPRARIHPIVADVARWGTWWPGMAVDPTAAGYAISLRPPGLLRPARRWTATIEKNRRDLGVDLAYAGDVTGDAEFYYLDETAGTVVHYVLRGRVAPRGWRGAVRDHRAGVRTALDALKDRFERDRLPGDEPDQDLLRIQQEAKIAFAQGVAAWERKLAADAAASSERGT